MTRAVRLLVEAPAIGLDARSLLEELCEDWGGAPFCELAVLLAATRALAQLHQSRHWQAAGATSYGDHLMFDRLYSATNEETDRIGERIVGLTSSDLVDPAAISAHTDRLMRDLFAADPSTNVAESSLAAELAFVEIVETIVVSLDEQGLLTYGLDNLLADIADKHEEHVYLLKRRIQSKDLQQS